MWPMTAKTKKKTIRTCSEIVIHFRCAFVERSRSWFDAYKQIDNSKENRSLGTMLRKILNEHEHTKKHRLFVLSFVSVCFLLLFILFSSFYCYLPSDELRWNRNLHWPIETVGYSISQMVQRVTSSSVIKWCNTYERKMYMIVTKVSILHVHLESVVHARNKSFKIPLYKKIIIQSMFRFDQSNRTKNKKTFVLILCRHESIWQFDSILLVLNLFSSPSFIYTGICLFLLLLLF
jgi:hypothetical protein